MKKLLVLVAVFTTVLLSNANAQGGNFDPAAMKARYLERTKPALIEKTKLSSELADKVLEISWEAQSALRGPGMRDMAQDERKKKQDEANAAANTKYKAIPLTDDQIKAVNDFFEEQRLQRQQRMNGGGGN